MAMCNLTEYIDNYSKTSRSLWECHRDEPNDNIAWSEMLKSNIKITESTPDDDNTKNSNSNTIKIIK